MENLASEIHWTGSPPLTFQTNTDGWGEATWDIPAGASFAAGCRVVLPETANPFWCIPGIFWGDNQQDSTGQYYPRFRRDLARPSRFESSFWEFHAWRAAQPLVGMHDGSTWWILEVAPAADTLCSSVGFEFENGHPVLVASLPASERPYRPVGHDYTMPSVGPSRENHSRKIKWVVRAVCFAGDTASLLGFLQTNYHSRESEASLLPAADYAMVTRNALMNWHYHPHDHYFRYTVAFDRIGQQIAEAQGVSLDRHEMALGWVSGWVVFEALVEWAATTKDEAPLEAVTNSWKRLMAEGLVSPSGFWWTRHAPQRGIKQSIFTSLLPRGMDGNWMADPRHLHLRTLGDAVLRAARTLRCHGEFLSFADELREEIVRQAEMVAVLARRGWPLPLSVDARTGKSAALRGTAGMIWISVWSELAAQGLWSDHTVIRDGLDHYRIAVESGQLYGAPEDVGECVTSEDVYIAINTYLGGYRTTGRREDLESCLKAAQWLYLWRKSFDHRFDRRTLIGAYDLKSRGGDIASFKNNHLHIYGLDAEESLLALAEITHDARWKKLANDHWAFSAQLTPLVDGQFNGYEGMVTEQFYFIDWSALGNSVRFIENDERRAAYDVGPYYRNNGNMAGFSHAWCTAFVLSAAIRRMRGEQLRSSCAPKTR